MMRRFALGLTASLGLLLPTTGLAATIHLEASLDCAQANAGAGTCSLGGSGTGSATITFDTDSNLLSWNLSYSGLSSTVTNAHFHGPATTSQSAGIQVGIGTANPSISSATITDGQEADLLAGLWYINVHTTNFSAGEIRGQVTVVPEPGTALLLGLALVAFAGARGRLL